MFQFEFVLRCGQQIEMVLFVGTTSFCTRGLPHGLASDPFLSPCQVIKTHELGFMQYCQAVYLPCCLFSSSLFDQFRPVMSSRVHHLPHKLRLSCSAGYHRTLALAALCGHFSVSLGQINKKSISNEV